MTNEISMKRILELVLAKIWLVILLMALGGTLMFVYTEYHVTPMYESFASLYVKAGENQVQGNVSMNELNSSRSLATTYIAVLKSDKMMENVGDALVKEYGSEVVSKTFPFKDGRVSARALSGCFSISSVDQTEFLKITAVTASPEMSAAACKMLAEAAPEFLVRVVGAGAVEIVDEPKINAVPVSPNKLKNILIGILAGCAIAVGLIILIDFLDNSIRDTEEVCAKHNKSLIGEMPFYQMPKNSDKHTYMITDEEITFGVVEAYKALRTNVLFSLSTTENKVIAISSSFPHEGKSTVAANLALSMAQMNKKVILIDADMRKCVQQKIFKKSNDKGLSTVISKMNDLDECIYKDVVKNLDLLTAGPIPPNPSELLASNQMKRTIESLKERYDYIIIDTPPVNVVSDAQVLSDMIAGVALVIKYAETTFDDIDASMQKLELSNTNVLGFVLTNVKKKSMGAYHYKHDYNYKKSYSYYGYGEKVKTLDTSAASAKKDKKSEKAGKEKKDADKKKS